MLNPPSLAARDVRLNELFSRWRLASKRGSSPASRLLFDEFWNELKRDPRFINRAREDAERQKTGRFALTTTKNGKRRLAWERAKDNARKALFRVLDDKATERRLVIDCGYSIHVAACTYWQHSRKLVTKLETIKGETLRREQPVDTAAECLKRLKRNLNSTGYIWKKSWAAMSPAALEALVRSSKASFPIFSITPSPHVIEPLLSAAIKFAARADAPMHEKRDDLLVTILLAYGRITGKRPTLSRAATNPTVEFMKAVELAYRELFPNGFDIPVGSHSKLGRLRARAVRLLPAQE